MIAEHVIGQPRRLHAWRDHRNELVALERAEQPFGARRPPCGLANPQISRFGQRALCLRPFEQFLPEVRHHFVGVRFVERDDRFER